MKLVACHGIQELEILLKKCLDFHRGGADYKFLTCLRIVSNKSCYENSLFCIVPIGDR